MDVSSVKRRNTKACLFMMKNLDDLAGIPK